MNIQSSEPILVTCMCSYFDHPAPTNCHMLLPSEAFILVYKISAWRAACDVWLDDVYSLTLGRRRCTWCVPNTCNMYIGQRLPAGKVTSPHTLAPASG